ncbi:MAG: hypothetical protein HY909_22345 [Deltaproteobacteria bacterium]|nr:hypothetical protein [Deltaproteobacteria bacterium]
MAPRWRTPVLASLLGACGTLGGDAAGDRNLPDNRTGPYRELTSAESGDRDCVVVDFDGLAEDPSALREPDGAVTVWVSRLRRSTHTIARAVLRDAVRPVGDLEDVYAPSHAWEGERVQAPSVARLGGAYVMAYEGAGGLGLATSPDGVRWTSRPDPVLTAEPTLGEGTLTAPSLLVGPDGALTLVYASAGALWMARAPLPGGPWTRVDARPETSGRDPLVRPGTPDGGAPEALQDPSLHAEVTPTGRTLWRVFFTVRDPTGPSLDGGAPARTIGLAASWDGVTFQRSPQPALSLRGDTDPAAPSMVAYDATRTLLYVGARCALSRLRRGVRCAVAPVPARLPAPSP